MAPKTETIRLLCAALAAVVIVDTITVRAPGLGLMAVPFIVAAVFLRRASWPASIALTLWSALYTVVGVNYAVSNGFHAGWGDLLFAYPGTVMAVAIIGLVVRHLVQNAHASR
jgi:hypothetical protein